MTDTLFVSNVNYKTLLGSTITASTMTISSITVSTMTASTIFSATGQTALGNNVSYPNRFVEVGSDVANSIYLDFHSSDAALPDYSTRIQSLGGATSGTGNLNMYAATIGLMPTVGVGVGTTVPTAALQIKSGTSAIRINGNLTNASTRPVVSTTPGAFEIRGSGTLDWADDGFLRLSAGGGTSTSQQSYIDLSASNTVGDMDRTIVFGTSGTERMRINPSGNVGIGTTNPLYALDIPSGKIRTSQLAMVGFTNIVHRRIFWGVGTNIGNFYTSITSATDVSIGILQTISYGPFVYGVPAVATGATRYFRLYVIYGDNMTAGTWNIDFVPGTSGSTVSFVMSNTYGGVDIPVQLRDGYSNTVSDPTNFNYHGQINIRANITGKGVNPVKICLNYLELQAIDQY